jgi:hypothetical protein
MDASLCPRPLFSVNRIDKTSAATGSCLLAKSVNKVMVRSPEALFAPGDVEKSGSAADRVPGRVVVLRGDRNDMGAHRITHVQKNAIVAQVELPVADERPRLDGATKKLAPLYDFAPLYAVHSERANEAIEIVVQARFFPKSIEDAYVVS